MASLKKRLVWMISTPWVITIYYHKLGLGHHCHALLKQHPTLLKLRRRHKHASLAYR